jgi:hypothetical protein
MRFAGRRPRSKSGSPERDQQILAGLVLTAAEKEQAFRRNVHGHRLFKPRDFFWAHMNRQGQPAPWSGATLRVRQVPVAIRGRVWRYFKVQGSRRLWAHIGIPHRMAGCEFSRAFGSNDSRKNLGLAIRERCIVRKRHPQGHARSVELLARNKHPATRNVQRFAKLGFLAEGTCPAKASGQAQLGAVMLASVHNPQQYVRAWPE